MALVRILVDGYSLLHGWPELAAGQPRHSASAREALIARLQQYRDMAGTPITIFFDGSNARPGPAERPDSPELEVLYSSAGRTADDLIERTAHRLVPYGEVLVVTDDAAEREVVAGFGAMTSGCANFIRTVETAAGELRADLDRLNRRERSHFRQSR
jgi:predicted RNA-binding protein with PIN domain